MQNNKRIVNMHFCFVTGLYKRTDPLMMDRQGKSLVDAGFKVTYVVCDDQPDEVVNGIQIISTGYKPTGRFNRFLNTKRIIKQYIDKVDADVYQISDPELMTLVTHLKRKGKKVVFNLREYYPDMLLAKSYIPLVLRKVASGIYYEMMTRYLNKYDAVFTVTDWILTLLRDKHKIQKAMLLTNFPVANRNFTLTKEEYMNRMNAVCYIGSIYVCSRQEKVLDALTTLPNVKYILAGRFDNDVNYVENHPYWSQVEFINGFARDEMEGIMERATISNTLRDFMGRDGSYGVIKIFESMEQALPVLLSDVPLHRHIVEKYGCGLCVDPNDSAAIAKAIKYLVEHKEEAYEMGQRGRYAVLKEYNWQKQAEKYINVISNL